MKLFNFKSLINRCLIKNFYSTDPYPYTTELYRKNYIKYPVQSKSAILHDYVYTGEERLPSLEERLKSFNLDDKEKKQIGKLRQLPKLKEFKRDLENKIELNKKSKQLELDSKELKTVVPIDVVNKDQKILSAFKHVQIIAEHYNIYKDLFQDKFFRPVLDLKVSYGNKQVFYGNRLEAQYTSSRPIVEWEDVLKTLKPGQDVYHSLLFVNLDGNFSNNENNVLLWFMSNVKNCDLKTGSELIEYLQPSPMRGTGWHRCVYLLLEHEKPINFELNNLKNDCKFLKRDFNAKNFLSQYEQSLVPVGLSFFQSEWDLSVKNVFHNYFEMKEPVYEFNFESKFVPKFEKYPKNEQPFNWYIMEYMDKKELNEQVIKDYIKDLNPFEYYPEPAKYPLLGLKRNGPRWHKFEMENFRKRKQQFSLIPYKYFSPTQKIDQYLQNLPYQHKK